MPMHLTIQTRPPVQGRHEFVELFSMYGAESLKYCMLVSSTMYLQHRWRYCRMCYDTAELIHLHCYNNIFARTRFKSF
jgi:hypothetical protein